MPLRTARGGRELGPPSSLALASGHTAGGRRIRAGGRCCRRRGGSRCTTPRCASLKRPGAKREVGVGVGVELPGHVHVASVLQPAPASVGCSFGLSDPQRLVISQSSTSRSEPSRSVFSLPRVADRARDRGIVLFKLWLRDCTSSLKFCSEPKLCHSSHLCPSTRDISYSHSLKIAFKARMDIFH